LKKLKNQLELESVFLYHGRAEEFGQDAFHREKYSFVTARAVARMNILSELTLPFLKKGGFFLAFKASQTFEEIEEAKNVIAFLGGKVVDERAYKLPITGDSRFLVIVKKCKETPKKYPRRAGVPNKNPII
jgi:16S rRNA (guanine527-N7)-methyltransferase